MAHVSIQPSTILGNKQFEPFPNGYGSTSLSPKLSKMNVPTWQPQLGQHPCVERQAKVTHMVQFCRWKPMHSWWIPSMTHRKMSNGENYGQERNTTWFRFAPTPILRHQFRTTNGYCSSIKHEMRWCHFPPWKWHTWNETLSDYLELVIGPQCLGMAPLLWSVDCGRCVCCTVSLAMRPPRHPLSCWKFWMWPRSGERTKSSSPVLSQMYRALANSPRDSANDLMYI